MSVLGQGIKNVASFSGFPTRRRQSSMVDIRIVMIVSKLQELSIHTLYHHTSEVGNNILVGASFTFTFTVHDIYIYIYIYHVELFDLSTTQCLVHNTQQVMEFRSGSLTVTFSFLTTRSCSWIKMGL